MMTDTLKKMNKLLGSHPLSAQCLYVQKEHPMFLVLEDLAPLGFQMACRLSGLDMDHCMLTVRGLARFHAASVAVVEKVKQVFIKEIENIFFVQTCQSNSMLYLCVNRVLP